MTIQHFLESKGIIFKTQYSFDDLRSPSTGWLLKFDFAIFYPNGNLAFLLEYDGEQHEFGIRFSPDERVNKIKHEKIKQYDSLKNEYCIHNNIELLRISYRDKEQMISNIQLKLEEMGVM